MCPDAPYGDQLETSVTDGTKYDQILNAVTRYFSINTYILGKFHFNVSKVWTHNGHILGFFFEFRHDL